MDVEFESHHQQLRDQIKEQEGLPKLSLQVKEEEQPLMSLEE